MVKEVEITGKMEFGEVSEECEHGVSVDDYCEDCRKEVISGLIGMTGIDRDELCVEETEEINLFDEDVEVVVIVRSSGIEHEIGISSLDLNIDSFKDIEPGDINAESGTRNIALERIFEVVKEIIDNI